MVAVLNVRQGRVMAMETHELEGVADLDATACLSGFLPQYYSNATALPRRVLVSNPIDDVAVVEEFLTEQRGGPVEVHVPQRGDARRLVERAAETALVALRQRRIVDDFDAAKTEALLDDLATRLRLPAPPERIECYDISNTMGTNSVGSMVVFEHGRPANHQYRHFGIKTVEGSNDFASIEETLRRRFYRLVRASIGEDVPVTDPAGANGGEERENTRRRGAEREDADLSFGVMPDLVLIDGGRGQLSAAVHVLRGAGLGHIPVFGLAKRNEELFEPESAEPIVLDRDSPTLFLVQRIRDEAHRFAITHHRARRGRAALRSRLDVVSGLGPARRRALLREFGSIDAIRDAPVEQLTKVVPRPVALRVKELL
jgi:excinuclease ABC subunit C